MWTNLVSVTVSSVGGCRNINITLLILVVFNLRK